MTTRLRMVPHATGTAPAGITLEGTSSAHNSTQGTSLNLTLPATIQAGDVIVIVGAGQVATSAGEVLSVTDWTGTSQRAGTSSAFGYCGHKVADGSEASAVVAFASVNAANLAVVARVYRGVDTTTPRDATLVVSSNASAATVAVAAVTTVTDDALIVAGYVVATNSGTNFTDWGAPDGFGAVLNDCSTTAAVNNAAVGTSDLAATTAGAYGGWTAAQGAGQNAHQSVGFTLALRPA